MNYKKIIESRVDNNLALKIEIQSEMYSKNTLFKTIYKLTDEAYFFVEHVGDKFLIYITPKETFKGKIESITDSFTNELLDQELRSIVLSETSKIRDTITTRALLSVSSQ